MIVLFTDFGLHGPYTGQAKAVLQQMAPGVPRYRPPRRCARGQSQCVAYLSAAYAAWFPVGTVFLCIVDPGVGGTRPAIALEVDGRWYVGPARVRTWSAMGRQARPSVLCAIMAVARKLANILHRMWVSETDFHVDLGAKVTQRLKLKPAQ